MIYDNITLLSCVAMILISGCTDTYRDSAPPTHAVTSFFNTTSDNNTPDNQDDGAVVVPEPIPMPTTENHCGTLKYFVPDEPCYSNRCCCEYAGTHNTNYPKDVYYENSVLCYANGLEYCTDGSCQW